MKTLIRFSAPSRWGFQAAGAIALLGLAATVSAADVPAPIQGVEAEVRGGVEVAADCQPFAMSEQDRALNEKVMEAMRADDKLSGRIGVSVLNGQVLLSGTVDSVPMIYRAVEVARRVTGNTRVNADRLERG